jgi:hypothetical protein
MTTDYCCGGGKKMRINRWALLLGSFLLLPVAATAEQSVQERMAVLCGDTMGAMGMSVDELKERATGCRQLLDEVKAKPDASDKVLIFRLEKCCNFFDPVYFRLLFWNYHQQRCFNHSLPNHALSPNLHSLKHGLGLCI